MPRITRPRCRLVYALAPEGTPAAEVNRLFNAYIGDHRLPLLLCHAHFIGQPGGLTTVCAKIETERWALLVPSPRAGWRVEVRPPVVSYSPAAVRRRRPRPGSRHRKRGFLC